MAESKWTRHEVQFRGVPNELSTYCSMVFPVPLWRDHSYVRPLYVWVALFLYTYTLVNRARFASRFAARFALAISIIIRRSFKRFLVQKINTAL